MEQWKITEDNKKVMSAFMADFWNMVKASYEIPEDDNDHYWSTLVKWADALGNKYHADKTVMGIVLGYLDGQSNKATGRERNTTA